MAKLTVETCRQNIWFILNGLLVLALICLLIAMFGDGDELAERATDQGRRFAINIKSAAVTGNPAALPKIKEAPVDSGADAALPGELPPILQNKDQQQMAGALPGNFVGEKLEGQQAGAVETEPVTPDYAYPEAVKQEPQTRQTAVAAPAKTVVVSELEASPAGWPLPSAPIDDLTEEVADGVILPRVGKNGKRPWEAYGKEFSDSSDPLIAVVVAGLGMNDATETAFRLQENFTLSFSPYSKKIAVWGNQARNAGHEVLIDLPMQTQDYPASDPGPKGLLSTAKPNENLKRLHWVMSRFPGYVGMMATIGYAIPPAVIQNCLSDIAARGLIMVELPATAETQPGTQKSQMGLLSLAVSHVLDDDLDAAHIQTRLSDLVAKAKKDGQAIGVAHAYPLTLQLLQEWQKTLAEQGVRLAPVSAIAARMKE